MPTVSGHGQGEVPSPAMVRMTDTLLASPDRLLICERLRAGHVPGPGEWCTHPAHVGRPEHHPCPIVRLMNLVEGLAGRGHAA
ncbi:hypothetical protein [Pseudonocardia alni]|uniref:hypothetical protein n=1 Tax=Pseudonocardia alni TaxID=33907 RepID=UPI00332C7C35